MCYKGRPQGRPFRFSFPGRSAARSSSRSGALQSRGPGNDGVGTGVPALRSGMKNAAPRPGYEKESIMQDDTLPTVAQSAIRGIACKCPRCGKGKLYAGFLTLRPACENCGLDYAFIDSGDGPAVFIIMIAGAIVVACALIVEI